MITCSGGHPARDRLRRFGVQDVDYLPVVDAGNEDSRLGIVHRQDLLEAHERELTAERH